MGLKNLLRRASVFITALALLASMMVVAGRLRLALHVQFARNSLVNAMALIAE